MAAAGNITSKSLVIDELPTEILCLIFEFVPKYILKTARCVSKHWAAVAAVHLFDTVVISPQEKNLEVFRTVCDHEIFSKYVRIVCYDATWFHKLRSLEDYEYMLKEMFDLDNFVVDVTPEVLAEGFELYRRHCEDQIRILNSGADYEALVHGFANLPGLQTIIFSHTWDTYDAENPPRALAAMGPLCRGWNRLHLRPDISEPNEYIKNLPLQNIVHALAHTRRQINALMHLIHPELLVGSTWPQRSHQVLPEHLLYVARGLKSLYLYLPDIEPGTSEQRRFSRFLRSAVNLESLDIACYTYKLIDDKLAKHRWTKLRSLSIFGIVTTEDELLDFLFRHSATLQVLNFGNIDLTEGKWFKFFDRAHAGLELVRTFVRNDLGETDKQGTLTYPCISDGACRKEDEALGRFLVYGGKNPFPHTQPRVP